jgi:hypothetical protein
MGKARSDHGGARRDRTDDLMLAKHALSQLSYGPNLRYKVGSLPAEGRKAARADARKAKVTDVTAGA